MTRRTRFVYGLLAAAWVLIVVWQFAEHNRVKRAARDKLIDRAKDASEILGAVMRSQRRFGVISRERLELALRSLIKPGELNAIELLNAAGDVVASAGEPADFRGPVQAGEFWATDYVIVANLVDLGTNVASTASAERNPTIVLPERGPGGGDRPPDRDDDDRSRPPPPPGERPQRDDGDRASSDDGERRSRDGDRGRGRARFGRPFWMSESEYQALLEKQGVHSFMIVLSTDPMRSMLRQDLWLRFLISVLAGVSALGSGLAWRSVATSSDLQIRLVRASEMNTHLKEMNLAAAGLAHETRNPLNIIRGLAQMISRRDDAAEEVRTRSREIVNEADKVAAQLNEFINYSRPRELRRTALPLHSAVNEVVRALTYDIEEKKVRIEVKGEPLVIEADEQLLRQALFNLVMNAVQAVNGDGEIQVAMHRRNGEGMLEIRDNGPGVPPDRRKEIFKPYFTTQEKGTGLGLAVVQQIVLAHGWEIECAANEPQGAVFRITHLKVAAKG